MRHEQHKWNTLGEEHNTTNRGGAWMVVVLVKKINCKKIERVEESLKANCLNCGGWGNSKTYTSWRGGAKKGVEVRSEHMTMKLRVEVERRGIEVLSNKQ